MKITSRSTCIVTLFALFSTLNPQLSTAFAQGAAFTYQGRLNDGANPAQGIYDLGFTIYDAGGGGNVIAGPLVNTAVAVSNGLFTVTLDFGSDVFTGEARWLEIDVRTNGGAGFATLSPRQQLTPTPYAIYSPSAGTAASAVVATSTVANSVNNNSLQANSVTTDKIADGTITDADIAANGISADKIVGGDLMAQRLQVGTNHNLNGTLATIAGGSTNTADGNYTAIGGGYHNTIHSNALYSTIGGGYNNTIQTNAQDSTIGGGNNNTIQFNASLTAICGGSGNVIQPYAYYSIIGGGYYNTIQTNTTYSIIGSGYYNVIQPAASYAAIGGGGYNTIQPSTYYATIAGGRNGTIQSNLQYATIGGGYYNTIRAYASYSTIAGGNNNTIHTNAQNATISGGYLNVIQTNAGYATVSGGYGNEIRGRGASIGGGESNLAETNTYDVAIGGGYGNKIQAGTAYATIGGGYQNIIEPQVDNAGIGSGWANRIAYGAQNCAIAGGHQNIIQTNAANCLIGGGYQNTIQTNVSAGAIVGGYANSIQPLAQYATVCGGYLNTAGARYSLAAGQQAQAVHNGTFVWADYSTYAPFTSTSSNQFLIRATGGVGIGTTAPDNPLTVATVGGTSGGIGANPEVVARFRQSSSGTTAISIDANSGQDAALYLAENGSAAWDIRHSPGVAHELDIYYRGPGGPLATFQLRTNGSLRIAGYLTQGSDRNLKQDFVPVKPREILQQAVLLPISSWSYRSEGVPHIGPMAQDFYAAFGLGADDKHIATIDADGVALAAIQGLNQKVEDLQAEVQQRAAENAELKARVEKLEGLLKGKTESAN
jgi:trimeric autotransporter adhesin